MKTITPRYGVENKILTQLMLLYQQNGIIIIFGLGIY